MARHPMARPRNAASWSAAGRPGSQGRSAAKRRPQATVRCGDLLPGKLQHPQPVPAVTGPGLSVAERRIEVCPLRSRIDKLQHPCHITVGSSPRPRRPTAQGIQRCSEWVDLLAPTRADDMAAGSAYSAICMP